MGGREVTRRQNCFFVQGNEWSRSYREINRHPSLPRNFITHGFLDPSTFPEFGEEKTNKHKQIRGIVPEMSGGQIVYVFPFFPRKKGNT